MCIKLIFSSVLSNNCDVHLVEHDPVVCQHSAALQGCALTHFKSNQPNATVYAQHTLVHGEWISHQNNVLLRAWVELLNT